MNDTPSDAVLHPRQGKAWSVDEDRRLYDGFVGGQTTTALVSAHGRSAGGIRARLVRLGLIDENGVAIKPIPAFAPEPRNWIQFVPFLLSERATDGWLK
jgi:hypothetical protein